MSNMDDTLIHNQGLKVLIWVADYYKKSITEDQLIHALGMNSDIPTDWQLRECADLIGLETEYALINQHQFEHLPLPAVIKIDHSWQILIKNDAAQLILIKFTSDNQPETNLFNPNNEDYSVLLIKEKIEKPKNNLLVYLGLFPQYFVSAFNYEIFLFLQL